MMTIQDTASDEGSVKSLYEEHFRLRRNSLAQLYSSDQIKPICKAIGIICGVCFIFGLLEYITGGVSRAIYGQDYLLDG